MQKGLLQMSSIEDEFKILKNPGYNYYTASIHLSGKMGFSASAIKLMNLGETKYVKIAQKKGEENTVNLYLIVEDQASDEAFRCISAGKYLYLNTTPLFNQLKFDYSNGDFKYEVSKYDEKNNVFKLTIKKKKVNKTKKSE